MCAWLMLNHKWSYASTTSRGSAIRTRSQQSSCAGGISALHAHMDSFTQACMACIGNTQSLTPIIVCRLARTGAPGSAEEWSIQAIGDACGGNVQNYLPIRRATGEAVTVIPQEATASVCEKGTQSIHIRAPDAASRRSRKTVVPAFKDVHRRSVNPNPHPHHPDPSPNRS